MFIAFFHHQSFRKHADFSVFMCLNKFSSKILLRLFREISLIHTVRAEIVEHQLYLHFEHSVSALHGNSWRGGGGERKFLYFKRKTLVESYMTVGFTRLWDS